MVLKDALFQRRQQRDSYSACLHACLSVLRIMWVRENPSRQRENSVPYSTRVSQSAYLSACAFFSAAISVIPFISSRSQRSTCILYLALASMLHPQQHVYQEPNALFFVQSLCYELQIQEASLKCHFFRLGTPTLENRRHNPITRMRVYMQEKHTFSCKCIKST